jgi:hypothetical protein
MYFQLIVSINLSGIRINQRVVLSVQAQCAYLLIVVIIEITARFKQKEKKQ